MAENILKMKNNNESTLVNAVVKNWHIISMLVGVVVSIIFSWAHFQSSLDALTEKVNKNEVQANVLSANIQQISPEISAINAKLDILLKQNGL